MNKNRSLLNRVVLGLFMTLFILTACTGNSQDESNAKANENEKTTQDAYTGERTVLHMISLSARPSITKAVDSFNQSNSKYCIELEEFFPYEENVPDADWDNAILKLNTRVLSGDIPDIIDLLELPIEVFYQKNLIEDLYPYIEKDPELQKESFFENLFEAMSVDGGLPYVTDCVSIYTMTTDTGLSGGNSSWTLEEFGRVLDSQEKASIGNLSGVGGLTGEGFVGMMLSTHNSYVDWSTGECAFDTQEFSTVLEMAKDIDEGFIPSYAPPGSYSPFYVSWETVTSACQIRKFQEYYCGNLNCIGFPNDKKIPQHVIIPGAKIAITSSSKNKEGAWEFARIFLTEEHEQSCTQIPINRAAFETVMQTDIDGTSVWSQIFELKATGDDVDFLEKLVSESAYCISTNYTVRDIVLEEAEKYFSGFESSQEAVEQMVRKVSLYIGEQLE